MRPSPTRGFAMILPLGLALVASAGPATAERAPPMEPLGVLRVPEKLLLDSGVTPPRDFLAEAPGEKPDANEPPRAERGGACVVAGDGSVLYAPPGRACK